MADKRIFVTIDTEMDANIHWKKSWPPQYTSIYEGIPNILRPLWDEYNVHPIYFLSPEILMDEKCCDILRDEINKGAIAGAHLHPEYIEPELSYEEGIQVKASLFPNTAFPMEIERQKIINLTELIERKLGVKPVWYRAARFGADDDTYKILDELGYKFDSSVTPEIDWSKRGGMDYKGYSYFPYKIEGTDIKEYPVTIYGRRWGWVGRLLPDNWLFYRWLRPTHMTYTEMKHLVKQMEKKDLKTMVMMFHSMEIMVNKTPFVRNMIMKKYYIKRLSDILKYCAKRGYSM